MGRAAPMTTAKTARVAMKIPRIYVDEYGHSYFDEAELVQTGDPKRRVQAKNQDVEYWQMREIKPGHFIGFKPNEVPQFVAVLSGRMCLTVSNGETRHFARGDMLMLQDVTGQGHSLRTLGHEPCRTLVITLPGKGDFK
jgi:quercetin dioxygenase-like cupin family protein